MGKQANPWHPCTECIDKLAEALQRLGDGKGRVRDTGRPQLSPPYSYTLEAEYRKANYKRGRDWMEFNFTPAHADAFTQQVMTPLTKLRDWERRAIAWQNEPWGVSKDGDDLSESDCYKMTGLTDDLCCEYDDLSVEAGQAADYLRQLAAMIRAKVAKTTPGAVSKRPPTKLRVVVASSVGLLIVVILETVVHAWHWEWLLKHPNTLGLQAGTGLAIIFGLLGAIVPTSQNWCWGVGLFGIVAVVISILGR